MSEELHTHQDIKAEPIISEGLVIILDVLGTRDSTLVNPAIFFDKVNSLLKEILLHCDSYKDKNNSFFRSIRETLRIHLMGDTIIATTSHQESLKTPGNAGRFINAHLFLLSALIKSGLEEGLLMRGAVSYGAYLGAELYLKDKIYGSSFVGSAITDAANWHELANWIGLVLTPKTGMLMEGDKPHGGYSWNELDFVQYSVPLSGHETKCELWCVPWPIYIFSDILRTDPALKNYDPQKIKDTIKRVAISLMSKQLHIPVNAEKKYSNTVKFIDYYLSTNEAEFLINKYLNQKES